MKEHSNMQYSITYYNTIIYYYIQLTIEGGA